MMFTTVRWSFIETAVLRIGEDTLEVTGGKVPKYYINGVEGDVEARHFEFSSLGLKVLVKKATSKQLKIRVDLLNGDALGFEVFGNFVRVNAKEVDPKWEKFAGSTGLMGAYPTGVAIGRDGETVFEDMNEFGQEWQVLAEEPKLFRTVSGPQHPNKCDMPLVSALNRRLAESNVTEEQAEIVCAHVHVADRKACITDVMFTSNLEMAGAY